MRLELDSATIQPQGTGAIGAAGSYGSHSRVNGFDAGSNDSAQVSGPSQLLNNLSTERSARIQQLTAAVRDGTYNVSSAAISQSLVTEAAGRGGTAGQG